MFPCNECSKLLIQAGIREVVYYEDKAGAGGAEVATAGAAAAGAACAGMLPAQAYAASRELLALAGVKARQHAPAVPLVLRVNPVGGRGGVGERAKAP